MITRSSCSSCKVIGMKFWLQISCLCKSKLRVSKWIFALVSPWASCVSVTFSYLIMLLSMSFTCSVLSNSNITILRFVSVTVKERSWFKKRHSTSSSKMFDTEDATRESGNAWYWERKCAEFHSRRNRGLWEEVRQEECTLLPEAVCVIQLSSN